MKNPGLQRKSNASHEVIGQGTGWISVATLLALRVGYPHADSERAILQLAASSSQCLIAFTEFLEPLSTAVVRTAERSSRTRASLPRTWIGATRKTTTRTSRLNLRGNQRIQPARRERALSEG